MRRCEHCDPWLVKAGIFPPTSILFGDTTIVFWGYIGIMENKMHIWVTIWLIGVIRGVIYTPIMENQMEKKMENEMETEII